MGIIKKEILTWKCDSCGKTIESKSKPNSWQDAWGTIFIDQDSGWDASGSPWCPRMRNKRVLCGKCIDKVFKSLGWK